MRPSLARCRELFVYDEADGCLYWRANGKAAGGLHKPTLKKNKTYRRVRVGRSRYMAHTIIWYLKTEEWAPRGIDHRDGDGTNNRFDNLRRCTSSENNGNQRLRSDNKLRTKGVSYKKDTYRARPFLAQCNGEHLGYFATENEAAEAYRIAAARIFGEFAKAE